MAKKAATKKKAKAKVKTKAKAKDEETTATKKKKVAKKTAKRKTRTKKAAAEARVVLFWGVFNHAMKPIAKYAFNQKKAAQKKASELSAGGKPQHFVAKIKEPVEE